MIQKKGSALIIMKPNIRKHLNLTKWNIWHTKLILLIDILRDMGSYFKCVMLLDMYLILDSLSIYNKDEEYRTSLIRSQHWFVWWFGAIKQQATN